MKRVVLTEEQERVAEAWGRGLAVSAGAGAGKTTTIVEKCRRLLEKNPEARIAAVSFTEKSVAELRERLMLVLPNGLRGHWVTTIHGLCGSILRENARAGGFEGEEQMLSPAEQEAYWQQALESLWYLDLEGEVGQALDTLLKRESRASLVQLLARVRELELSGAIGHLEESQAPESLALARLARFVLDRYTRLKRRRGGLDFSDLERGADQALEDEGIRRGYHRRFDLVLVDEFQDTNPVQARILERFVRPDFSNLCVVGDPKQSIYRFRDADVSVFEAFCQRMPERITLTQNRRSRPGIIEYVNRVCSTVFEASGQEYVPLAPVREEGEYSPVERLDVDRPEELADWVVAQRDAGVPLEKMALLMVRIRGNEKWLRALASRGIPLAIASGGLFWSDPRVREMVALLRWWDQPLNRQSAAVFLRAPWVAVPDATLDEWFRNEGPIWDRFEASLHPIARALAPLRGRLVRPAELLRAMLSADAEGAMEAELDSAWLGLWHRCEELSRRGASFHEAVQEISRALEEERRERDVPPPANRGQLRVLTVHGSKGLEFDHVLLVDFGLKPKRRAAAPLLYWNRERGVLLGGRDADGDRIDNDEEENAWRAVEEAQALAESKRVFYVALTRARERLLLAVAKDPPSEADAPEGTKKRPSKVPVSPLVQDYWKGWIESVGDAGVIRVEPPTSQGARLDLSIRPRVERPNRKDATLPVYRPRHSVTEWNLLGQCGRAYQYRYVRTPIAGLPVEEAEESKEVIWVEKTTATGRDPKELGIRVHSALERSDLQAIQEIEDEWGPENFRADAILEWARKELFAASEAQEEWNELSFEVPVGQGETLVGSLDRLVKKSDGTYQIIDYKVIEREKSPEALRGRYRDQLWIYAWAIGRLEPQARDRVRASLLAISPQGVREVAVGIPPSRELDQWIHERWMQARQIVGGVKAEPKPHEVRCRSCEFRKDCDAAYRERAPHVEANLSL
jgi:ATP-dependent helicase/nuclease subunit A